VDLDVSRIGKPETSTDTLQILFVGRLSVEKGVETLIHACRRLRDNAVPFELRIIGDGPLRISLEGLADQFGMAEQTSFIGKVPRARLGTYYSSADVVCVPSLSEPLATAVLEALVSECPVVATDTGGNPFMISHEQNGLITPVGDVEALAKALERLYRNPELLRTLTEHARPSVLERFSWGKVAQDIASYILK
jgi:glycosyltransferase involved in cell wall biosynthesis